MFSDPQGNSQQRRFCELTAVHETIQNITFFNSFMQNMAVLRIWAVMCFLAQPLLCFRAHTRSESGSEICS